MGTLQRFALQALFRVVGFETIGANNGARARRTPLTVRSVVRGVSRSPVARVRPETSRAMRTSSSRPSSRHAARVSALVAIALCAFAPIAVSAAGAPSGSTPRGAVGDALRSWIDANGENGVELEGVYLGEHDGVAAAYRAGGAARRDVGVFAASGGLDAGEAYVSVPWSLVLSAETVGARRSRARRAPHAAPRGVRRGREERADARAPARALRVARGFTVARLPRRAPRARRRRRLRRDRALVPRFPA